ncbi:MAG TPA: hypothetical protein VIK22_03310 [Candidatus Anoxymicrobiaceae bacterium]|jgi:hypothetical protein
MKTWSRVSAGAAVAGGRFLEGRAGGTVLDLASILACRDSIRAPLVNGSEKLMLAALRSGGKRWPGSGKLTRERILWARSILCTADRVLGSRFVSPHVARTQFKILARTLPTPANVCGGRVQFQSRFWEREYL